MGLCDLPGIHEVCQGAGSATGAVAGSAFQSVVDAFAKGLTDVVKALMTFWIDAPQPDVSSSSVITTLNNLTRPLVAFSAILGLILGGTRLAWTARHEQPAQAILRGLLLMVVVTGAGASIVEVALSGFDALAKSVLDHGFDGTAIGDRLNALGTLPGVGGGLVFLLAFFGMIASLVQVGVMLVRGAILAVLVGVLPIAASASINDAGFAWFKRLCGWISSFVLYKLVAAIIYAAAFTMIGTGNDLAGIVSGFSLLIVAILALPALLRLLPPSAEAMGGSGGGAMVGVIAAAATGAVSLAGASGSSTPATTAAPGLKDGGQPTGAAASQPSAGAATPTPGPAAAGAATATGPVGATVTAAQTVHSAATSGAREATGEGDTE